MTVLTGTPTRAVPAWASGAATASGLVTLWIVSVTAQVHASTWVRDCALLVHLAALVIGLGAVVVIDWTALRWLLRRSSYAQVRETAKSVDALIWSAVIALMVSGAVLNPDTSSTMTQCKLALVLVLLVNGLHARALGQRLTAGTEAPSRPLLVRATVIALVSQISWWSVMFIGHVNTGA
jgi:hypothetical protein